MYELLFSSQQPQARDFRRHCFIVLFPHVRQQLSDKSHAMEIEGLTSCVQALEITNEDKDTALALLNDDLQNRDNQIKAIQYENVELQAQRMYIRTSYKNAKALLPILRQVMFLMQKIQAKTTLL